VPTATPTGEEKHAVGTPRVTLPPTDMGVEAQPPSGPAVLVALGALLLFAGALLLLLPGRRSDRQR
jgi:hypothetical protein